MQEFPKKVLCVLKARSIQSGLLDTPPIVGNEYTAESIYDDEYYNLAEKPHSAWKVMLFSDIEGDIDENQLVNEEFKEKYATVEA